MAHSNDRSFQNNLLLNIDILCQKQGTLVKLMLLDEHLKVIAGFSEKNVWLSLIADDLKVIAKRFFNDYRSRFFFTTFFL